MGSIVKTTDHRKFIVYIVFVSIKCTSGVCFYPVIVMWLIMDEKGLPPTPDTLRLGCSYHLHSSHRFLSTWGAVTMLEERKKKKKGYC